MKKSRESVNRNEFKKKGFVAFLIDLLSSCTPGSVFVSVDA